MRRFTLPCRAATVRGIIRHSHLGNRFLSALPNNPDNLRTIYPPGSKGKLEFLELTDELLSCLEDPMGGFCAAGLVDTLPAFRELSDDGKKQLKKDIVSAYAEQFQPVSRAAALQAARATLLERLDAFLAKDHVTRAEVDRLREAALALDDLMLDLPRGIWLWPQQEESK